MDGNHHKTLNHQAILGCLLGTAVGDALGLPAEGLSPKQQRRLFGQLETHRLLFGRGMISDDTEHTFLTALAWLNAPNDPRRFAQKLALQLRFWFVYLPPGIGMATARACMRLWLGVSPQTSGVASAGNGATMRAAILGVLIDDLETLTRFLEASSRLTHTDPRAVWGAWLVGVAAWQHSRHNHDFARFYSLAKQHMPKDITGLWQGLDWLRDSLDQAEESQAFATRICGEKGVSGFVLHSVPVCLHVVFTDPQNFQKAMLEILACGGDTDSNAAVVGGIVGARVGQEGIPRVWQNGLLEGVAWSQQFVRALEQHTTPPRVLPWWQGFRNIGLLLIVLAHGFWRLLRGAL
jgi:ADP-ribosyl-[dinitrogen reductase] hydrolase